MIGFALGWRPWTEGRLQPLIKVDQMNFHGGTLTAESREGQGSTFTVRLPLRQRESMAPALAMESTDDELAA